MRFFIIGLVVGLLLVFVFIRFDSSLKAGQPISFNHKTHVTQGIECSACHPHYKEQTFSGLPTLKTCLECHNEPLTESPEEEKIRQFHKKGEEVSWKRLYRQPDHVFFSHRRHVTLGKLECQTCHGNIGQSERPPSKPQVKMTMGWCMDCHTRSKASNDCLVCHV